MLADELKPRGVMGAFLPLVIDGHKLIPWAGKFYRKRDAIVNPNYFLLKNISNHLRIFSVQSYKLLPQIDLRDTYGRFY